MGIDSRISSTAHVPDIVTKSYDNVENPKHYTSGEIEVIDYIQDCCGQFKDGFVGFCLGNVIKYVSRHDKKNGIEDLKKAKWYLTKVIDYKLDKKENQEND